MTQLWPAGQLIMVTVDEHGTPVDFTWQEQRHAIAQVIQRWEIDLEWWRADEWRLMRLYD